MLSLSMVVIAALVGADGLGKPVVRALNTVNVARGFEAGLAIVLLAIMLDRLCRRPGSSRGGLRPMPAVAFEAVDIVFGDKPQTALPLIEQGLTPRADPGRDRPGPGRRRTARWPSSAARSAS